LASIFLRFSLSAPNPSFPGARLQIGLRNLYIMPWSRGKTTSTDHRPRLPAPTTLNDSLLNASSLRARKPDLSLPAAESICNELLAELLPLPSGSVVWKDTAIFELKVDEQEMIC
jgi:hypothetical protein